ncbi:hypothetical protein [Silvimonas iriomotensis]|uniref:Uncharacterized protein n=1 Tax=Silvimonas iriomotensis TaxID=449662 RepID=A0ABQ2PBP5_9NEIS|nr:hypothetical protein [Silvimonas iriomotensis]GGP22634.1 hypothetical protein GCM10010970_26360 [Silvimonas iriomotensis]
MKAQFKRITGSACLAMLMTLSVPALAAPDVDVGSSFKPQYKLDAPTDETAQRMFDELAYQRAVQVYLWGLSAVGTQQYRKANGEARRIAGWHWAIWSKAGDCTNGAGKPHNWRPRNGAAPGRAGPGRLR